MHWWMDLARKDYKILRRGAIFYVFGDRVGLQDRWNMFFCYLWLTVEFAKQGGLVLDAFCGFQEEGYQILRTDAMLYVAWNLALEFKVLFS